MTRLLRERYLGVLTVLVIFAVSYALGYGLHQYGIALDNSWLWTGYAIFMAALLVRALLVRAVLDLARRRFRSAAP
jgi:general stress protein CsbA